MARKYKNLFLPLHEVYYMQEMHTNPTSEYVVLTSKLSPMAYHSP